MTRAGLAIVVAPVLVPLLVGVSMWGAHADEKSRLIAILFATVFAYTGFLALGGPALRFIWSRNHTGLWPTVLVGVLVGTITWLAFSAFFAFFLDLSLTYALGRLVDAQTFIGFIWPVGLGAIVGVAMWFIARPDSRKIVKS